MKMIRLGELRSRGEASKHLMNCLSGQEFPLAGVAEGPYVPGSEILDPDIYVNKLYEPSTYLLVKTTHVLQALAGISVKAHYEAITLYGSLDYLPFLRSHCTLLN